MKYIIERTSCLFDDKPIPTAHVEKVHKYDYRRKKSSRRYEEFIASCHDIKETSDGLLCGVRNEPDEVWVDEIEDLHKFVEQHGCIILKKTSCEEGLWSVEIYDDYRE